MRARAVWWTVAWLVGLTAFSAGQAQTNLLPNGGFEDGVIGPYGTYGSVTSEVVTELTGAVVPEGPIEGQYALHLVVPAAGANSWDAGMTDNTFVWEQGKKYTFACFMKTKSGTLQVRMKPERAADPYENYNEIVVTVTEEWQEFYTTTDVFTAEVAPASPTFHIAFAAGDFWIDGIRLFEGDYVPPDFLKITSATNPSPADDATDVRQDTVLSWEPGPYAATHNVYVGSTFDDVNNADVGSPLLVSQGQTGTTYDPPGLLEFGQTYYWRIDEVNAAPDLTVHKGNVWNFTVEPRYYQVQGITATASIPASEGSGGPEATVDGSGLTNGAHGVADTTMWSGEPGAGEPVWLQYDFDRLYKLYGMHVWNYNGLYEFLLGFGFKDVTIEYAVEPNQWVALGDYQLARGTNKATYAGQQIDLDGVAARSIRITANSNQSGGTRFGLSEVQFFYKPVVAREPQPASGATDVDPAVALSWRPGREATSHQVQLSTDPNAVADGAALVDSAAASTYSPPALSLGTQYFWRIDEVNEAAIPSVWAGPVWDFTTTEFLSLDNFESYTDDEGNRIYEIWLDGYDVATNGSLVGHDAPPYAEQVIRNNGSQSMPLYYDNTGGVAYSEAELSLTPAKDLTANGADTLSLYYRGVPPAFLELPSGSILMNGTGDDIVNATDQFRFAYKQLTGEGSITARVDRLDNTHEWAKAGVMIRTGLATLPLQAHMVLTPPDRTEWQYRPTASGNTTQADTGMGSTPFPYWVRITRQGTTITGQRSADGQTWLPLTAGDPASSTVTLALAEPVYIGLVVSSHTSGPAGAQFSNVSTTGNVGAGWQLADVGADQVPGNAIDAFYLAVQDSAGKKATLFNPDPYAVAAGAWTEWAIPLSDLSAAGVNTKSITKLYLGVGDRTKPSQNASGVMYIDDIAHGRPLP